MTHRQPTLVQTRIRRLGPGLAAIHEFEAAIREGTSWRIVTGPPGGSSVILKLIARIVRLCSRPLELLLRCFPTRNVSYLSIGYIAPHYLMY
ncbi:MAG: hypothetical protein DLM52_00390, partial [Chthoniobacterales bacterium]